MGKKIIISGVYLGWWILGMVLLFHLLFDLAARSNISNILLYIWMLALSLYLPLRLTDSVRLHIRQISHRMQVLDWEVQTVAYSLTRSKGWLMLFVMSLIIQLFFYSTFIYFSRLVFQIGYDFGFFEWFSITMFLSWLISFMNSYLDFCKNVRDNRHFDTDSENCRLCHLFSPYDKPN